MSGPRLKVLCLHGFTSNGAVHAYQLQNIVKALPEYEFVFPDGPHKVDIAKQRDTSKPENRLWTHYVTSMSTIGHRAWWYAKDGKDKGSGEYTGLSDSLNFIGTVMERDGPFHAIWGFSQGACFAGILCALLQSREKHPPLRSQLPEGLPPPSAGLIFSGFKARFPQYAEIYAGGIGLPMMHVLGVEDYVVSNERSQELANLSSESVVLKHTGGHEIPNRPEEISQIAGFLRSVSRQT